LRAWRCGRWMMDSPPRRWESASGFRPRRCGRSPSATAGRLDRGLFDGARRARLRRWIRNSGSASSRWPARRRRRDGHAGRTAADRRGDPAQAGSTRRRETIRVLLESHDLKPWREKMWCVAKLDEEYIARMEDVLGLYERPLSVREPVVVSTRSRWCCMKIHAPPSPCCLDELPGAITNTSDAERQRFCGVEPKADGTSPR